MKLKSVIECERNSLEKLKKYQLPNSFKNIGFAIAIVSFLTIVLGKFFFDSEIWNLIGKYGITIGLLIASISKEKIEDEFITKIRMMSYSYAFIFVVFFSFTTPFLVYIIESIFEKGPTVFKPTSDFQIFWTLLAIQLMFFNLFKRYY